jgi:hypothetical protein
MLMWAGLPKPMAKFYLLGVIQSTTNIGKKSPKLNNRCFSAILTTLTINH